MVISLFHGEMEELFPPPSLPGITVNKMFQKFFTHRDLMHPLFLFSCNYGDLGLVFAIFIDAYRMFRQYHVLSNDFLLVLVFSKGRQSAKDED